MAWDVRDSKRIWEIYASIYIFNAHLLMRLYVFAMPAISPGGFRPPPQRGAAAFGGHPSLWIPLYGGLAGGEHSKNIQIISKCALDMYIDAYISQISLESLSSQSSHSQLQASRYGRRWPRVAGLKGLGNMAWLPRLTRKLYSYDPGPGL